MAASNWKATDQAKLFMGNGSLDFDANTVKIALYSSSAAPAVTDTAYSTTNELATANGYTQGGTTVTTSVSAAGSTTTIAQTSNAVWTASGGSIAARFGRMYVVGTYGGVTNPIIAFCTLDATPADVTATTGNTLTVASGTVYTITGATT